MMDGFTGGSLSRQARIGIIGGGAAGLSLAWYLGKAGFTNVVVLESSDRAGGKCQTEHHEGLPYDVGAVMTSWYYSRVRSLARAVGAQMKRPGRRSKALRWKNGTGASGPLSAMLLHIQSRGAWIATVLRYMRAWFQHRAVLAQPGFVGIAGNNQHACLAEPFGEWARERRVEPILELFRITLNDMGYGEAAKLPAAYVMKYMNPATLISLLLVSQAKWLRLDGVQWFVDGFGTFFQQLAKRLDVRLGARVSRVVRGHSVAVTWQDKSGETTEAFDTIVVTCDPRAAQHFMDWDETETAAFSGIESNEYVVTLCELENNTVFEAFYVIGEGDPNTTHSGCRHRRDSQVASFYTQPTQPNTDQSLLEAIKTVLPTLWPATNLKQRLATHRFDYFPHVDCQAFSGGFYERVEQLQGARNTWYAGGLLAFESVETVVRYSEALAQRMLAAVPARVD